MRSWRRPSHLSPDDLEIPYQQALLESTVGNNDKAVEILKALVKQSDHADERSIPCPRPTTARFFSSGWLVYRDQTKYSQAMEMFRQIQSLGPLQEPRAELLIIETVAAASTRKSSGGS